MSSNYDYKLDHKQLTQWYKKNQRALPWRENKDPYRIWLSEVMLQQTTVVAVIPYFEKFLKKFPTVQDLAQAPENEVLEAWAGLGYYSRARNLHKAAKALAENGFPKTAAELLELPGFGPYTSRAVASIAFGEKVGVLDGNVIRVLSRRYGLKLEWWNNKGRETLQKISDELSLLGNADVVNQGLMELGATVCTPQKVTCMLCPWVNTCVSREKNLVEKLPLKKPRKESEVWVWKPFVAIKDRKVALVKNDYAPFLKGQMIFPGEIAMEKNKPKDYDVKHNITHHDIFIQIHSKKSVSGKNIEWVELKELKKVNPSSLLQKVLHKVDI
ncbi:A/G-specific adenine glycosylase [Bdellovibrio bacteriovorus]|uniref:Adenine DNA glycosylase n=1 Tax=Bdellovibrio bacteriovorus TaxID=959 RepID=A0A162GMV1_BDEBC|nr:A/G-specific adenine glycosylase [Bdellovibrio bacteriovorus]KYG68527.1 A/G-specific adenine glycosylase [Bdellovibrio bacteriovorus]